MAPLHVRPLRSDELDWSVELHREALPHGFFARLGPRFLGAYQRTFVDSPYALALAAEQDGKPVGFVVGVVDPALHRSWLVRRRRLRLALLGMFCLLARPRELLRFATTRTAHYGRVLTRRRPPRSRSAAAVLTHLAVDAGRRRGGAGRRLAEHFVAEARRRDAAVIRLTTLRGDEGADAFWRALGWAEVEVVQDDEGRANLLFEREL